MMYNKENKRAKRSLNNSQTLARANETKKKYHRFLHPGKPNKTVKLLQLVVLRPLIWNWSFAIRALVQMVTNNYAKYLPTILKRNPE